MYEEKSVDRRSFLRFSGVAALALYAGCSGALVKNLKQCCSAPAQRNVLRVMTYNIANARGNNDDFFRCPKEAEVKQNLENIVTLVKYADADIICMNEVDFNSKRTHNIDQAEYIAKRLCYNHVLKETMFSIPSIMELGNAVVSRYPLKMNSYRQYGGNFLERVDHLFKSYVDFDVELDDINTSLNLVLTHLDARSAKKRDEEVSILLDHLDDKQLPFVLMGDFNCGPGNAEFERIISSGLVYNKYRSFPTYPSDAPTDSLDHILISPELAMMNYHPIQTEVSDHLPVVGDIIL
jgi:endonuclease/exonuclease/phosphatase family metal-dependent hydrolase